MLHMLARLLAALFPRRPAPTRVLAPVPIPVLLEEDRGRYHPYPPTY